MLIIWRKSNSKLSLSVLLWNLKGWRRWTNSNLNLMLQPWKNLLKVRNPKRVSENLKTILLIIMMRIVLKTFQGQLLKNKKKMKGPEISSNKKLTLTRLNWHLKSKWDRISCKVDRTLKSHHCKIAWRLGPRILESL